MLRKALFVLISATPVFCWSLLTASEFSIGFTESEYDTYYDAASSTLDWDFSSGYLYLSYGNEEVILEKNYPGPPSSLPQRDVLPPTWNRAQSGYTFLSKEDCFISGVARFTSWGGGNPIIRLWTNDAEENSSGISNSWLPSPACGQDAFWVESPVVFFEEHYPLTKNNTYWIANVHDGIHEHLIGQIPNPVSGSSFVQLLSYWFVKNDNIPPSESNREGEGGVNLQGIADLHLKQFESAGSLTMKVIDLGAGHNEVTKVDIENFEVTFQTANARSSFNKIETIGDMAYNLCYTTIAALGRTPVCSADFEISESSDNVSFSEFKTDFTDFHQRYIKLKMTLETQHRGITPLIDDVKIAYNAYPGKISTGSINISPSILSSRYEILVTSGKPRFIWPASFDLDGDEVTYDFVLSKDETFLDVVFSTSVTSVPSTTDVEVICSEVLQDRNTYYFKFDLFDVKGASVSFGAPLRFQTELAKFLCTASSVSNDERVLLSQIQSGISFTFSKEVDFSTESVKFLDDEGSSVPYSVTSLSDSELAIVPFAGAILSCRRYSIEISTALRDLLRGGPLEESFSIDFLTLNDRNNPYEREFSGAKMVLPPGSVSDNYFLEVSTMQIVGDAQLEAANNSAIGSAFVIPVSTEVFLVDITDVNGMDVTFISGASLTLPFYADTVDVEGVSVSLKNKLRIFMLNKDTGKWVLVQGVQNMSASASSISYQGGERLKVRRGVVTSASSSLFSGGSVTAGPVSGGKFALLAYPENIATSIQLRNIPNPFYLGQVTEIISGLFTLGVKNVKMGIYTLVGHKIYEKNYTAAELGEIKWDGKNKDGAYVGSGIYILKAEINYTSGESEVKTRKIGFIRSWD